MVTTEPGFEPVLMLSSDMMVGKYCFQKKFNVTIDDRING